jgi:hypothetical protein
MLNRKLIRGVGQQHACNHDERHSSTSLTDTLIRHHTQLGTKKAKASYSQLSLCSGLSKKLREYWEWEGKSWSGLRKPGNGERQARKWEIGSRKGWKLWRMNQAPPNDSLQFITGDFVHGSRKLMAEIQ